MDRKGLRYSALFLILALGLVAVGTACAEQEARGPLEVKNRFPMHLGLLTARPQGPAVLPAGRLMAGFSIDYSSIYFDQAYGDWEILMDMETTVVEMKVAYGIAERLQIDLSLPFIRMSKGFMDGFLEQYHSTFGFPNYGREQRPANLFGYIIRRNGQDLVDPVSESFRPGDLDIGFKLALGDEAGNPIEASLRLVAQAPTGNAVQWTGNSGWDWSLALPARVDAGKFFFYLTPSLAINASAGSGSARLKTKPVWGLFSAFEYCWNEDLSLIGQVNIYSPPFIKTGIKELDQNSIELAFGFRFNGPLGLIYEGAFCEDLSRTAPDFTVHLAIYW